MSNYQQLTKHPITGKWEFATWIDDHFGRHRYGVQFGDGTIFPEEQIKLTNPVVSLERVLVALFDAGVISSTEAQQRFTPKHGACCTCQALDVVHAWRRGESEYPGDSYVMIAMGEYMSEHIRQRHYGHDVLASAELDSAAQLIAKIRSHFSL